MGLYEFEISGQLFSRNSIPLGTMAGCCCRPTMAKRAKYEPISIEQHEENNDPPHSHHHDATTDPPPTTRELATFAMLGLLNNTPYVIMLACAKNISEGGVGLVYLANIVPSLVCKLTLPYWFDKVTYGARLGMATGCMMVAFGLVAAFAAQKPPYSLQVTTSSTSSYQLYGQFVGVALVSWQCGLGEATLLSLAGKLDHHHHSAPQQHHHHNNDHHNNQRSRRSCLTCFASGTGLAGPLGYLWKVCLNEWLQASLRTTVGSAMVLGVAYYGVYHVGLAVRLDDNDDDDDSDNDSAGSGYATTMTTIHESFFTIPMDPSTNLPPSLEPAARSLHNPGQNDHMEQVAMPQHDIADATLPVSSMSCYQRFVLVLSLWPYMVPLFVVYAAEYACQSGAWTAMATTDDLTSAAARNLFYERANWLYQAGVFVSRSSGTLVSIGMWGLWIMPAVQCGNLLTFSYLAAHPTSRLYHVAFLYPLALFTGLLGGAVYVHGYQHMIRSQGPYAEFALGAVSVAEGAGVLVANVLGLYLQACLYAVNALAGAVVQCPV